MASIHFLYLLYPDNSSFLSIRKVTTNLGIGKDLPISSIIISGGCELFGGGGCYYSVKRLKESFTSCVNDCDNDWFIIRRGVTATAIPRLHFWDVPKI